MKRYIFAFVVLLGLFAGLFSDGPEPEEGLTRVDVLVRLPTPFRGKCYAGKLSTGEETIWGSCENNGVCCAVISGDFSEEHTAKIITSDGAKDFLYQFTPGIFITTTMTLTPTVTPTP